MFRRLLSWHIGKADVKNTFTPLRLGVPLMHLFCYGIISVSDICSITIYFDHCIRVRLYVPIPPQHVNYFIFIIKFFVLRIIFVLHYRGVISTAILHAVFNVFLFYRLFLWIVKRGSVFSFFCIEVNFINSLTSILCNGTKYPKAAWVSPLDPVFTCYVFDNFY